MTAVACTPADQRHRLRAARVTALAIASSIGAALLLGGCSSSGASLAREACAHVDASIHLYVEAEHARTTGEAHVKVERAVSQLNQAEQLAARANSADPSFNPLMTTLQEIGRTSEANLIPALRAQCTAAQNATSTTQSPVPGRPTPGTVPGSTATHS